MVSKTFTPPVFQTDGPTEYAIPDVERTPKTKKKSGQRGKPKKGSHWIRGMPEPDMHLPARTGKFLSDEEAQQRKDIYLAEMGKFNNQSRATRMAEVSPTTILYWKQQGYISQAELDTAYRVYQDSLRELYWERMENGTPQPFINKKGEVDYKNVINDMLLIRCVEHALPEFQKVNKSEVMVKTADGTEIPASYHISLDARDLTVDEFNTIKGIVEEVERRKAGVTVIESE